MLFLDIISEVRFGSYQYDGDIRAMLADFWLSRPLNALQRCSRVDGKSQHEDISGRIGQKSEPVVIFISHKVPEPNSDVRCIDGHLMHVIKGSWDKLISEVVMD